MDTNKKQTVLVVDDIPHNITVLNNVLCKDYRVLAATSGQRALDIAFGAEVPDIILLDVMMPDMDGFQVCEKLKSDPRTKKIPVIFITALDEVENEERGFKLGAVDYITKPFSPPIVITRVKTQLALYDKNRELQRLVDAKTAEINETQLAVIERLGKAAEYKDNLTKSHTMLAGQGAEIIALAAGMSAQDAAILKNAMPMHDIGKMGIPDRILQKPGPLTEAEINLVKKHARFGSTIIGDHSSKLLQVAKEIAQSHHEKWDGTGYPTGLAGNQIPLVSRVAAIVDVLVAMISDRPYRKAMSIEAAAEHIEKHAGTHFDPELVKLLRLNMLEIARASEQD